MAVFVGVNPGGRNKFAVSALFYTGRLPVMFVGARSHSGVEAALKNLVGIAGEWGELGAVAIAAPLTWSGAPNGLRPCDLALRAMLPDWAPQTWVRAPNSLPGAIAVQGPALAWALAQEVRGGLLPKHKMLETHPAVSLANVGRHLQREILAYRKPGLNVASRRRHVDRLVEGFVDAGLVRLELGPPKTHEELDALVCSLTALAVGAPDCGLVTEQLEAGDIRPLGNRPAVVIRALP
jgi:hypothetical protein